MENINQELENQREEEIVEVVDGDGQVTETIDQQDIINELEKVEMNYGLLISDAEGGGLSWDTNYDLTGHRTIFGHLLRVGYEGTEDYDVVRCSINVDEAGHLHTLIQTSAQELPYTHANLMISALLSMLRQGATYNEEVIQSGNLEQFDSMGYLIDTIGKLHTLTNIIPHQ